MGDLLSILSAAQSSLSAQRAITATASHNVDNANNPDYSRQVATLEAVVPGDAVAGGYVGRGATLGAVTSVRDRFLEAQIPVALGNAARSTAESDALQAVHALDPGTSAGLDTALGQFYASLRALSQNPGDAGLRSAALGATRGLAKTFVTTAQQIAAARSGVDSEVTGLVDTINGEARAVADLNAQIRQASGHGTPNDLLDLRQKHVDALAQLTGATPVTTSNGDVNVTIGATALVAGTGAATLSTLADTANGGHLRIRARGPDGTGPFDVANATLGGTLGGALAARDGALGDAALGVDRLAYDLAGSLDAANGYDPTTQKGGIFRPRAGVTGAAAGLTVALGSPAELAPPVDPAAPGDGSRVAALISTESAPVAGASGAQEALAGIVSTFGGAAASAKAFADQDAAVRDHLTQLRQSVSGVSIDDEMITLQAAQRGYEAIAKVIQTADELMQTLIGMIP